MSQDSDEVVYSITNADLQKVADGVLERQLTRGELKAVADALGDFVDWRQSIRNAIEVSIGLPQTS